MAGQISAHEADHAEDPVQYHGDPDTNGSVAHVHTDDITETDAEHEHREYGQHHGKAHVIAGTKHVRQYKRCWPQKHCHAIVDHDQNVGQLRSLRTQSVAFQDLGQTQQNDTVYHERTNIRDLQ